MSAAALTERIARFSVWMLCYTRMNLFSAPRCNGRGASGQLPSRDGAHAETLVILSAAYCRAKSWFWFLKNCVCCERKSLTSKTLASTANTRCSRSRCMNGSLGRFSFTEFFPRYRKTRHYNGWFITSPEGCNSVWYTVFLPPGITA